MNTKTPLAALAGMFLISAFSIADFAANSFSCFGSSDSTDSVMPLSDPSPVGAKEYSIVSPDGSLTVGISVGQTITWSLSRLGQSLLAPSPVSMTLSDGTVLAASPEHEVFAANEEDNNGIILKFQGYDLIFRAFDEGVAYRFVSRAARPFEVVSEQATFALPGDWNVYVPYVKPDSVPEGALPGSREYLQAQFVSPFENHYSHIPLSEWEPGRIAFLPLMVEAPGGVKLCITETDLTDYPGMYLGSGDGSLAMTGYFAPYPKEAVKGGYDSLSVEVKSREDFIAKYDVMDLGVPADKNSGLSGDEVAFPWRIVAVSAQDRDLLSGTLPFRLATPAAEGSDFSWVRPGKVAWDWWNEWIVYGVDFRSGINNDTYKYYIDFASEHGIEYVILDLGWSEDTPNDLMRSVPEIDVVQIVDYAAQRNVGIILWACYWAFDKDMENVCRHYSELGVKGFKVDYMNRDDQVMVQFERRAAEMAAKYHLLIDFHGTFKPVGLHRAFPNVLNYEGVHGMEQMRWSGPEVDQVTYDVTIPFIRMYAGPLDYTQGAMRNATKGNYRPVYTEPMSQGTRCRQLAEYVVFDSPLAMLCDSPSAYLRETECLDFISCVPTVWDETVPLGGEVGKYVAIARRSGDTWYVGAMTDWDAREIDLDLSSFLPAGRWEVEMFTDGPNVDRVARDYSKVETVIESDEMSNLTVNLAPGGGFAAVLRRQ